MTEHPDGFDDIAAAADADPTIGETVAETTGPEIGPANRRRNDPRFNRRVREIIDHDRDLLDRLAQS